MASSRIEPTPNESSQRPSGALGASGRHALLAALLLLVASDLFGASIWRRTSGGLWSDANNWSSPTAPTLATGGVYITNNNSKIVLIDDATPITNLFITGLNVWGPANSTNTLLLSDTTTNRPLVVSNQTATVANRGLILVTNSSLVVTGRFISFNVWAGEVRLESGSILARETPLTTNVTVYTRVGRTNLATVTINDGTMETSDLYVGESPGAQFARSHGRILMNGGLLTVHGEFSIAKTAGCTGTVEVAGGRILVPNNLTNILRVGDMGAGSMTLSNAEASVGDVSVARHDGSSGTLVLWPGGVLHGSDDFSVGRFSGATGAVFVAGGELDVATNAMWIGREGSGQLVVSNGLVTARDLLVAGVATNLTEGILTLAGGTTRVLSNFIVGAESLSTGQVMMTGGVLLATNSAGGGVLDIRGGVMTLNGGEAHLGCLVATNAGGQFNFDAGTLHSQGSEISNGRPFVVGNGTNPATFVLEGGTHVFADGLILSSNATLTGCGTILGVVTSNGGLISTNCGSAGVAPSILQQPASLTVTQGAPAAFSVTATGDEPLSYAWLKGSPGVVLPDVTDPVLLIPSAQPADAGQYRVRIQNASGSVTSAVAILRVLVTPTIATSNFGDGGFRISCPSISELNYFLEYKERLDDPTWSPLGSAPGTGALITLIDPSPSASSRFYRLRVE